jgi:hypothetical protein
VTGLTQLGEEARRVGSNAAAIVSSSGGPLAGLSHPWADRKHAQLTEFVALHQTRSGNVTSTFPGAQARENVTLLIHLDSPAGAKRPVYADYTAANIADRRQSVWPTYCALRSPFRV